MAYRQTSVAIVFVIALTLSLGASPAAAAVEVPWSGERTAGDGIDTQTYNAFNDEAKLTWDITYDAGTQRYSYTYAFFDGDDALAPDQFIFQVSEAFESSGAELSLVGHGDDAWTTGTWENDVNHPTLPADIHGVKILVSDTSHTIITDRAPTWGDFYWTRGSPRDRSGSADAWNTGLGTLPDETTQSYQAWVAVPGEQTSVVMAPTPTAGAMGLVLLGGLVMRRGRSRRR